MQIYGTETEFGIASRQGRESDPVADSLFLINHYPRLPASQALWDYDGESPLSDSRGFEVNGESERPDPEYNRLLNKPLYNGGRLYVDGAHPEYATPECSSPREVLIHEKAGEQIAVECVRAVSRVSPGRGFIVYKNNTDGKGNSYGYHENYLCSRQVPFKRLTDSLIPFFVTRQIFAGAGKVGAENRTDPASFQIAQRSDFFETLVGLNTMSKRPIMNTRDEPHAVRGTHRRIHVIVGDSNMAELPTYVKIGATGIILDMIEAGASFSSLALADPIEAMQRISRDLRVTTPLRLADGRDLTAIEIQRAYLKAAQESVGHTADRADVLRQWTRILDALERDPLSLVAELDWVAKYAMIVTYMDRKGCGWDDPRIRMMDFQYHDVRPEKGLYFALLRQKRMARLVSDEDVSRAETEAPKGTRAYFRSACLKKFPKEVHAASWTSLLFNTEKRTRTKLPLLDPSRGTEQLTKDIVESSDTVAILLSKLAESSASIPASEVAVVS